MTQMGTLCGDGDDKQVSADHAKATNAEKERASSKATKGMEGYSFEDEECWERQMNKELAAKKKDAPLSGPSNLSLTPLKKTS